MDYKKYSLENLENWMHDAMSVGEATPQEIYDVIISVVKENYYVYKQQASQAYELLALLNGNGGWKVEDVLKEREYYEGWDKGTTSNLVCDKDNQSPECQKSWNDFWEDSMPPWGHSDLEYMIANPTLVEDRISNFPGEQYTEEELNAMCHKASSDVENDHCREYSLREAEYYDKRAKLDAEYDKVVKWQLPVEVDGLTGDCYVEFPEDLLAAANLKEGDQVEWVDQGDGSYLLRKV